MRPPGVGRAGIWAAVSRGVLSEAPSPDPGCSMRPCTHVLSDSAGILRYHSSRSNPDPGGLKKTFRVSPDYKNTAYLLRKKKINLKMNRVDSEKALYSEVKVAVGARLGECLLCLFRDSGNSSSNKTADWVRRRGHGQPDACPMQFS